MFGQVKVVSSKRAKSRAYGKARNRVFGQPSVMALRRLVFNGRVQTAVLPTATGPGCLFAFSVIAINGTIRILMFEMC